MIVAILFASQLEDFLAEAVSLNMTGEEYVYICPSSSVSASVLNRTDTDDPKALATAMQGMFTIDAGSPVQASNYTNFIEAWLDQGQAACEGNGMFEPDASIFADVPTYSAAAWVYDATVAVALALLGADNYTDGEEVLEELLGEDAAFEGASGMVVLEVGERKASAPRCAPAQPRTTLPRLDPSVPPPPMSRAQSTRW